jgi:hypothetical protein
LEGGGGRIKIFFQPRIFLQGVVLDQEFFYREDGRFQKSSLLEIWREGGEKKIFFGPRIFFTGRMEGFKSRLCLRFGGKGGRKTFFSRTENFFTGKGKGAFLGPRKNKGAKREKRIKGEKNKKCISITVTGLLLKR